MLSAGLRRALRIPAVVLWVGLVVLLSPVWLPVVVVVTVRSNRKLSRFLQQRRGRVYFVWHARRGWYDFVRNNVVPVLPQEIAPVRDRRHGGEELRMLRAAVQRGGSWGLRHPALLLVNARGVHVADLNAALRRWKMRAAVDPVVRMEIAALLRHKLAELGGHKPEGWA